MRSVARVTACAGLLALAACTGPVTPDPPSDAVATSTVSASRPDSPGSPPASSATTGRRPATTATAPGEPDRPVVTESPTLGAVHRTSVVIVAPSGLSEPSGVDSCTGLGAYAELSAGDTVRVVDGSGTLLTSVDLGSGRPSGEAGICTWSAEVAVPTDRSSYRALVEGWGSSAALSLADLYQPIVIEPRG